MNTSWDPLQKNALWAKYLAQDTLSPDGPYERFCIFFHKNSSLSEYEAELSLMRSITPINNHSWKLYYFLCISGAIYALCAGFDGMFSVLSVIFPQLHLGLLVGFCVLSALCASGIFIVRDKPSVMDALELPSKESCSVVDEYIFSLQRYMHLQSECLLDSEKLSSNVEYLGYLKKSTTHLGDILADKKEHNSQIQQTWHVWLQSSLVVFIGGLLYFSDGFFIGQNVACLFMSPSLMLNIYIAAAIGICALAAYWFVERQSLEYYLYGVLFTDQNLTVSMQTENHQDCRIISLL